MRSTLDLYRCTSTTLIALGLTFAACSSDPTPVVTCGGTTGTLCNDGDACTFSGDCNVGSICNTAEDPYFDVAQGANVCVRLVCAADTDCKDGKTCTREKICQVPACQADSQCTGGTICSGGACVARTKTAIIIGVWNKAGQMSNGKLQNPGDCHDLTEKLAEQLSA